MARWVLWISTVITLLITVGAQPDLRAVLAVTLVALAVALIAATLVVPAAGGRITAVQGRRETLIAPRQCDPDAAGRPRPRAPSTL